MRHQAVGCQRIVEQMDGLTNLSIGVQMRRDACFGASRSSRRDCNFTSLDFGRHVHDRRDGQAQGWISTIAWQTQPRYGPMVAVRDQSRRRWPPQAWHPS
jgi:hypothetical protein